VQLTSTKAAQYVWKSARRFRIQIIAAELPILIIKLASCLKSCTVESNWTKKARGNSTEKIM
jgi:hypothetical protein